MQQLRARWPWLRKRGLVVRHMEAGAGIIEGRSPFDFPGPCPCCFSSVLLLHWLAHIPAVYPAGPKRLKALPRRQFHPDKMPSRVPIVPNKKYG